MLVNYFVALLVSSITIFALAIFTYLKGKEKRVNQTFALYSVATALWAGAEAFSIITSDRNLSLFLWRLNHVGVIFIPVFFIHFVYSLLEIKGKKKRIVVICYLISIVFLIFDFTKLLILEVVPKFSFKNFINPGIIYPFFFSFWIIEAIYGLYELIRAHGKSIGVKRNQLKYLTWGTLIGYLGG